MGDLRNKAAKQERDEAHRQYLAKRFPAASQAPPIRCQCGLTPDKVSVMWAHQTDRWSAVRFYCPSCLPDDLDRVAKS